MIDDIVDGAAWMLSDACAYLNKVDLPGPAMLLFYVGMFGIIAIGVTATIMSMRKP